jgi:hypothetical protein
MKSKKSIVMSSLFYIFMLVVFIAIISFGLKNVFFIEEKFSESQKLEYENKIKNSLNFCSQPLNSGSVKTLKINKKYFNSYLLISNESYKLKINTKFDFTNSTIKNEFFKEIDILKNSKNNLVLLKINILNDEIFEYQIVSSFQLYSNKNQFIYDFTSKGNNGKLKIKC